MIQISKYLAFICLSVSMTIHAAPKPSQAELTASNVEAWLDGQTEPALRNQDLAGMSVVVIKDGEVLLSKGYGYADIDSKKPFTADDTLIRPGSVSKLFTWTAVMQLAEQGVLNLDTDVNQYLDFELPQRDGGPITLRHLMTHRAGLEESLKGIIVNSPSDRLPLEQWLKNFIPHRVFAVDSTAAYSNYGSGLAGYIVQRVTGIRFEEYIAQKILTPLGMNSSTFEQPVSADLEGKVASSYMLASAPKLQFELITPSPAGGLTSTANDMGLFIKAFLSDGDSPKLMQNSTRTHMLDYTAKNLPEMKPMTLGFFRSDRNGLKILSHGGDTRAFHSDLILIPEKRVGLFISISGFGKEFYAARLRSDITNGFIDRYFPSSEHSVKTPMADAGHEIRRNEVLGHYQISRASFSTILAVMNPLTHTKVSLSAENYLIVDSFKDGAGNPWKWIETKPYIWQQMDGSAKLSFQKDSSGHLYMSVDTASPAVQWKQMHGAQSGGLWTPLLAISLAVIVIHILTSLVRIAFCWRYKLDSQWIKAVKGFRWSSVVYLISIGLFSFGFVRLQNFETPDLLFRLAQIGIATGLVFTILVSIPMVITRFKQRSFVKMFTALAVAIAQVSIVTYLTLFNFWSFDLLF